MTNKVVLVTAYANPDLDGTACMIAYAEYLRESGINAVAGVFGGPHREAQFVMKYFNIKPPSNGESYVNISKGVILVDASELRGISEKINPERVVELIDHRKVHEGHRFPKAKIQVEFVGAAATLIAEKFHEGNIKLTEKSAALLYSAIVSNTINFKAKVTTQRDKEMAKWLKKKIDLPKDYIKKMFTHKSELTKPLGEIFREGFAIFEFSGYKVSAVQLEIVGVEEFIKDNLEEIKGILISLKKEYKLDVTGLTCIDVEKGSNTFVVIDDFSKEVVGKAGGIKFKNGVAKREGIILRKELTPLVKKVLEEIK